MHRPLDTNKPVDSHLSPKPLRVIVHLFGPQAHQAGTRKLELSIGPETTCRQLKGRIAGKVPAIAESIAKSRIAINHRFADSKQTVREKDELALIGMICDA